MPIWLKRRLSVRAYLCLFLLCLSAQADLQVNTRLDKVILDDGSEIECIVLMVSSKAVLVAESDPKDPAKTRQRIIPAGQVKSIIRGEATGALSGFQTDAQLAQKVIQGTGYRRPESSSKQAPQGPLAPASADPVTAGKAAKLALDPQKPASTSKLSAKDLTDAYLSRFPVLKSAAQNLVGLDRLVPMVEQAQQGDPLARKQVEGFLKFVLSPAAGNMGEKTPPSAGKPAKPSQAAKAAAPAGPAVPSK